MKTSQINRSAFINKSGRGFTLIELLIVIAIIGLLTSIVMTSLTAPKAKARDAKRVSDLSNIQLALSLYFDRCHQYPDTIYPSGGDLTTVKNGCPNDISLFSYISTIPTNADGSQYGYATSGSPPNEYVLYVTLEGNNDALKDDIDGSLTGFSVGTVECGSGSGELIYCITRK